MNDRTFMAVLGVILVAAIGAFVAFGGNSSTGNAFVGDPFELATGEASAEGEAVQRADHVIGPVDAKVTLIEYGDFACPACQAVFPQLKALEGEFAEDLRIIFRHNPLTQIHPNAFAAHRAAVAADNQGMFWEMHDLMYERQREWAASTSGFTVSQAADAFESYAEELGLDLEQFRSDVESDETFNFIDSHLDSGANLGVTGTPTLFLNGEEIAQRSFEELSVLVREILSEDQPAEGESAESTESTEATEADGSEEATEN